jgi:hypothetical protein
MESSDRSYCHPLNYESASCFITNLYADRAGKWAQARQQGQPTASDKTINGDMIFVAQAITIAVPDVVIATTNVGHLSRFVAAELWQNIALS